LVDHGYQPFCLAIQVVLSKQQNKTELCRWRRAGKFSSISGLLV